jgi:hypothetical protein
MLPTECLICGRLTTENTSGQVVIGDVDGSDFVVHTRCLISDPTVMGTRLGELLDLTDGDGNPTDLGRKALR